MGDYLLGRTRRKSRGGPEEHCLLWVIGDRVVPSQGFKGLYSLEVGHAAPGLDPRPSQLLSFTVPLSIGILKVSLCCIIQGVFVLANRSFSLQRLQCRASRSKNLHR